MGIPGFVVGPGGDGLGGDGLGGDGLGGDGLGGDGLGGGDGELCVEGQLLPQQQNLALDVYDPAQVERLPSYCK